MYSEGSNLFVTSSSFYENKAGRGGSGGRSNTIAKCGYGGTGGSGGGMFSDGPSGVFSGCTFRANETGSGGHGGVEDKQKHILYCTHGGDGGHGGGLYNMSLSFEVTNCTFIENKTGNTGNFGRLDRKEVYGIAGNGAGIYNINSNGLIVNSQFNMNETGRGVGGGNGAGIYNDNSSPAVSHCSFHRNRTGDALKAVYFAVIADTGGDGAGMYNGVHSSPIVTNCIFTQNRTGSGGEIELSFGHILWGAGEGYSGGDGGYGAGMYNGKDCSPTLIDCIFKGNITGAGGKGQDALAKSSSEWFVAGDDGGKGGDGGKGAGLYNDADSSSIIEACTFLENETGIGGPGGKRGWSLFKNGKPGKPGNRGNGAAIASVFASAEVSHSIFAANIAYNGGGVYNDQSTVDLINCVFRTNQATHQGSGVYNINSDSAMTNSMLFSNGSAAYIQGHGIYNDNSHPILTNCILWNNLPGEIQNILSTPVVTYCNVKNGTGQSWFGAGCIDADPIITDIHGRLSAYSPCRGIGSLTAPQLPERDMDGNPRITGTTVDLGAYEFSNFTVFNDTQNTSYDFIQSAIDAANENDSIRVLRGTYTESINFRGKAVRLYSEDGPDVTIIDGSPKVLLQEDFNDGNFEGWTIIDQGTTSTPSNWVVESGQLVQKSNIHGTPLTDPKMLGTFALWGNAASMDWTDYAMTVTMRSADDDAMGVMFRYQDTDNYYRFAWLNQNHGQGVGRRQLSRMQNGQMTVLAHDDVPYTINQSYQVKIAVSGSLMQVSINGVSVLTATDSTFVDGSAALFCWGNQGTYFDDVEVVLPSYHVVQCVSGEGPGTILEGFTITGGNADGLANADKSGGGMYNFRSSPTVIGCVFTDNSAVWTGGGIYNQGSNPTVTGCTFTNNTANSGGGIGNYSSSPVITHCDLNGNSAGQHGGGIYNWYQSPIVTHCTFSGNSAPFGGGISNQTSRSTVINCTFTGNTAFRGGGMNNGGGGWIDSDSPTVINCTFAGNSASDSGGAMTNVLGGKPAISNSIFWGNTAPTAPEIHIASNSSPTFTYCAVQGESVWPGTANINADPRFIDAAAGNLRLDDNSPCIDTGSNSAVPEDLAVDLDGDIRLRDGNLNSNAVVDMGAYEYYGRVKNTTANSVYRNIQNAITDSQNGDRIVATPGVYYEKIDFTGRNISLSSIAPDDPSIVAQTILHGQYSGGSVVTFNWSEGGNGQGLLEGLTITGGYSHDGAGIYCHASHPTIRNCVIRGNRAATSIVKAVGGSPSFIGCTVINNVVWGSPMWDEHVGTVLFYHCPDIRLEDCSIHNNRTYGGSAIRFIGDQAYHASTFAMVGCSVTENLHLHKSGSDPQGSNGGGIYFYGGQLSIEDCYIADNTTRNPHMSGGGLWIEETSYLVQISRSYIINNQAGIDGDGGGIGALNGHGYIDNCDISGNSCGRFGGGISGFSGDITNTLISDNSAGSSGGGVYGIYGSMTNCTVSNNVSGASGGGLAVSGWNGSWGNITNCVFTNNSAANGGGLSDFAGSMSNCLILGNRATSNGGGFNLSTGHVNNSIIRQNYAAISGDQLHLSSVPNYSSIQDWAGGGTGNIAMDPGFRQQGKWVYDSDPNIILEPDDPNSVWVDGNYRLSPGSPCIDAGDNSALPAVITTDLQGWPRFIDDLCTTDTGVGTAPLVDMGAYEFLPADMNGSGFVNLTNFSILAAHWQQSGPDCEAADINCDGVVDLADLAILMAWWLE